MKVIAKVNLGMCPGSCNPCDSKEQGRCNKVDHKIPTHYNGKKLSEKVINEIQAIEKCYERSIEFIELRTYKDSYYYKLAYKHTSYTCTEFNDLKKHIRYTWCIFPTDFEIYITPELNEINRLYETK